MVQALLIYVGGAAKENLQHGLETGLWGFTNDRAEYERIRPEMWVVFAHALHPGGPRSSPQIFHNGRLSALAVGRITGPIYPAEAPHWLDEFEDGNVKYAWRFPFDVVRERTNIELGTFTSTFSEALRHSGTQYSQGEVIELSESDLALLDAQAPASDESFPLRPGDRVTRRELNERFGGGIQGGMLTPRGGRYMFLFSDPIPGKLYGYKFDGWADSNNDAYYYTGEGSSGPQQANRKNRALLESGSDGREVHLFIAVGTALNSDARIHEYAGQFALDAGKPFRLEDGPDSSGEIRSVYVFKLNRLGERNTPKLPASDQIANHPAEASGSRIISKEAANVDEFERSAVEESTGRRRERALEARLIEWLEQQGKDVTRLEIRIAGHSGRLLTDSWVDSDRELFEVKGDTTRENVRMAVGQLLDYRRHIHPPALTLTVVLPKHPGQDLVQFAASVGLNIALLADGTLTRL